jgi:hypothetical protein
VVVAGIAGGGGTGSTGAVGAGHAQPAVADGSGGGLGAGEFGAGMATGVPQSHTAIGSRGGFGWFVAAAASV